MSYTVAITGASGNLGSEVTKVFLAEYGSSFSRILALVRNPSSDAAKALAAAGAELVQIDDSNAGPSYEKALQGVDVLVNVQSGVSVASRNTLFDAALKAGVKVYFPTEYGLDHRINDFPGWEHREWVWKREHLERTLEVGKGKIKTIAVFTGLFLEGAFGPWFGFDHANHVYTSVGPANTLFALTAKPDIGRAIASFALVALADPARVPDIVRINGTKTSYQGFAEIVQRVRKELGSPDQETIVVKSEDPDTFREGARKAYLSDAGAASMLPHLRIALGEGKFDFAPDVDNGNEIANPGEKAWKWTTVEDYVRAVRGSPFS